MEKKDFEEYFNKKISIALKNNYFYKGRIEELQEDHMVFIDKFNSRIRISYDAIAKIAELRTGVA